MLSEKKRFLDIDCKINEVTIFKICYFSSDKYSHSVNLLISVISEYYQHMFKLERQNCL